MTFTQLLHRDTAPTAAEVAATIAAELQRLADEFGRVQDGAWPGAREFALRLSADVCAEMHKTDICGKRLHDLIRAYQIGDRETTLAAHGRDRDDQIEDAAEALVKAAEAVADEWRQNVRVAA